MTVGNAIKFIKRGLYDSQLRKSLNSASNLLELHNVLEDEKLIFSVDDFDEAFHHSLSQCQEEEQAEQIKEFKLWWELLSQCIEPARSGKQYRSCC